jgi:hypothetical protein
VKLVSFVIITDLFISFARFNVRHLAHVSLLSGYRGECSSVFGKHLSRFLARCESRDLVMQLFLLPDGKRTAPPCHHEKAMENTLGAWLRLVREFRCVKIAACCHFAVFFIYCDVIQNDGCHTRETLTVSTMSNIPCHACPCCTRAEVLSLS